MTWKTNFRRAQAKVKETALTLQLAQSKLELVQLKARQQETSYQSGGVILPAGFR